MAPLEPRLEGSDVTLLIPLSPEVDPDVARIESSGDLVDWTPVAATVAPEVTLKNAAGDRRFYRLVVAP